MPIPPYPARVILCEHCGRLGLHCGRGLCKSCYSRLRSGGLGRHPRKTKPSSYTLNNWYRLTLEGNRCRQVAEAIGMSQDAVERAVQRARKEGDPRAIRLSDVLRNTVRRLTAQELMELE